MALTNASVPIGATYAPSGGSAKTFKSLGQDLNQNRLYLDDTSPLLTRATLFASVRPPSVLLSAPNGYTQQRVTTVFQRPKVLANGKITSVSLEIKMSYDIESSAGEVGELIEMGQHLFTDADFSSLWLAGATN